MTIDAEEAIDYYSALSFDMVPDKTLIRVFAEAMVTFYQHGMAGSGLCIV